MHFVRRDAIARDVATAYRAQRKIIRSFIPSARVRHIGSTAIPGSITKGDIDILVSVDAKVMVAADRRLSRRYKRNNGSGRSSTFSAFLAFQDPFSIGVQLVTRGSSDEREFLRIQSWLSRPSIVKRYNSLKRAFEGKSASGYRKAKHDFMRATFARLDSNDESQAR